MSDKTATTASIQPFIRPEVFPSTMCAGCGHGILMGAILRAVDELGLDMKRMLFVSGIYFPIEIMPAFLRGISAAMPLRYMADALRHATGVMDMSPARFWSTNTVLLGLGLVLLPLLARYIVRADRR